MSARHASVLAAVRSVARRAAQVGGVLVMVTALGGCEQAVSGESGNSSMVFGLFKSKYRTTVRPEVGGALKRESAFPTVQPQPTPAYPVIRNVSADAPPPTGTLAAERRDRPPAEAFIVDGAAGRPAVALVNTYGDRHSAAFWEIDGKRFGKARAATFDAAQPKWLMWSSEGVLALPAGRILFHLKYHDPRPKDAVFLYDAATDRVRRLGEADPDWARGLPFQYLDSLQVRPEVALARYSSEEERIGPQRYVNHFEHLLLFSPRHPEGLEIVTLGLDDGHVRRWGMVGNRLWLETADDRASPAGRFFWSLDLTPIL